MKIVIIGLSLSSSWGNGHATTYRSLIKGLEQRGHGVTFFERSEYWYEDNRDLEECSSLRFYTSAAQMLEERQSELSGAELIIIGSYVRDAELLIKECRRRFPAVLAFYDIDTPVTIGRLREDCCAYLRLDQLPLFDLYFSFSGGPVLDELRKLGAKRPLPLYCSVDPEVHARADVPVKIDLGYLGTWSADRQAGFDRMLLGPAADWRDGRFAVAGPQYPDTGDWPRNVRHVTHLAPREHADFYSSQRFTLNLTRADMRRMGFSPSVRLFEAASCGTPVISDDWEGLDEFFRPGTEILTADSTREVLELVKDMPDSDRAAIAAAASKRVLESHTGARRAAELEAALEQWT